MDRWCVRHGWSRYLEPRLVFSLPIALKFVGMTAKVVGFGGVRPAQDKREKDVVSGCRILLSICLVVAPIPNPIPAPSHGSQASYCMLLFVPVLLLVRWGSVWLRAYNTYYHFLLFFKFNFYFEIPQSFSLYTHENSLQYVNWTFLFLWPLSLDWLSHLSWPLSSFLWLWKSCIVSRLVFRPKPPQALNQFFLFTYFNGHRTGAIGSGAPLSQLHEPFFGPCSIEYKTTDYLVRLSSPPQKVNPTNVQRAQLFLAAPQYYYKGSTIHDHAEARVVLHPILTWLCISCDPTTSFYNGRISWVCWHS